MHFRKMSLYSITAVLRAAARQIYRCFGINVEHKKIAKEIMAMCEEKIAELLTKSERNVCTNIHARWM